jgi:hypothetical protein
MDVAFVKRCAKVWEKEKKYVILQANRTVKLKA